MIIGDLTLLKCLGKGAFGEVYLTSKQGHKDKYATKRIDRKFFSNPKAKKYLENEICILKEVDHPNIIKLIEVQKTTNHIYLVMELCNGGGLSECLEDYKNKNNKAFPEEIVQYLMRQIVSGINYLHKKNILHRDIKLDNILINYENEEDKKNKNLLKSTVKIIDFGFARHLEPSSLAFSTLGSPINMDPGLLRKLNKMENSKDYGYDQKADIWSLGTICYEMLIGKSAFDSASMRELITKVERGNYYLPKSLSKEAVSFLNGMLQYDLKKRLSAEQLYNHKFLTKPYSELCEINLKEAQNHLYNSGIKLINKKNQSIWAVFETDEENNVDLDKISPNMYDKNIDNIPQISEGEKGPIGDTENKPGEEESIKRKVDDTTIKQEFSDAYLLMNDDFIYIEPKLIPIIPGDDPTVINKVSEFSEDNF